VRPPQPTQPARPLTSRRPADAGAVTEAWATIPTTLGWEEEGWVDAGEAADAGTAAVEADAHRNAEKPLAAPPRQDAEKPHAATAQRASASRAKCIWNTAQTAELARCASVC